MTLPIYAVVYQMGKVASTSLVATLDSLPGVTAVQSHFLGEALLQEILPSLVNPAQSDYFHAHQLGQFKLNIEVTRRINMILSGHRAERLLILSLTRDPLDWFRSSLVQDMQGYAPDLLTYGARHGLGGDSDDARITAALPDLIGHFAALLDSRGGIDAYFEQRRQGKDEGFEGTRIEADPLLQQIFRMMLRPYTWFEHHFERARGFRLSEMDHDGAVYTRHDVRADYLILRYEDIDTVFIPAMAALGLTVPARLQEKNLSAQKAFAEATRAAFATEAGSALAFLARRSAYARRFRY